MAFQQTEGTDLPPTILCGTAPPFARVTLRGFQYAGQTSPMPGTPFITEADSVGRWVLQLEAPPHDVGHDTPTWLLNSGPWTVELIAAARPAVEGNVWQTVGQVSAIGCWVVGDAAACEEDRAALCDYR
eukprot:SAG11_NODE_4899_length_1730_cov_1.749847_2_plen_129_part_00